MFNESFWFLRGRRSEKRVIKGIVRNSMHKWNQGINLTAKNIVNRKWEAKTQRSIFAVRSEHCQEAFAFWKIRRTIVYRERLEIKVEGVLDAPNNKMRAVIGYICRPALSSCMSRHKVVKISYHICASKQASGHAAGRSLDAPPPRYTTSLSPLHGYLLLAGQRWTVEPFFLKACSISYSELSLQVTKITRLLVSKFLFRYKWKGKILFSGQKLSKHFLNFFLKIQWNGVLFFRTIFFSGWNSKTVNFKAKGNAMLTLWKHFFPFTFPI